jgi:hypothetical protein
MGDKVNDDGNGATGYNDNDNDNDDDNNTSLMMSNEGDKCQGQQSQSR